MSADFVPVEPWDFDTFTVASIKDSLDDALAECEREPATDLWTSFWDRLTDGEYVPAR